MTQDRTRLVAAIIRDAGGRVVGRTKLQKITFILEQMGLCKGFEFEYYHYGPFSEGLASATKDAVLEGIISEKEQAASWGGSYSTYEVNPEDKTPIDKARSEVAQAGAQANSVELELAATALYLKKEGHPEPWQETSRRKPDKADGGRLERAKILYSSLSSIKTPKRLPKI